MKLETTARMLKSALKSVGWATRGISSIPVLGMVLFDGSTVTACDLDMEISVTLPTRMAEGSACIPYDSLLGLVSHLPGDETVRIETGERGATVVFSTGRYDLPTLPISDFPIIGLPEDMVPIEIDGDRLKKALRFVSPFISTEETRYYLNGVCLDGDVLVATDGHRMGVHPHGFDGGAFDRGIIPKDVVFALLSMPAPKGLSVSKEKPRVEIRMDGARIRAKLIDGKFPDWRRVVPSMSPNAAHAKLDRAALLRIAKRMAALGPSDGLSLAWDAERLAVAAKVWGSEVTARETMPVLSPSSSGSATYNARFLKAVLQVLRSEVVTFRCEDDKSPSAWRGDGEGYALLMPMREVAADLAATLLSQLNAGKRLDEAA
ncbi:DNA polymerase III subunit beta [Sinorhizobium sp. CCBAU 05631]|uniref:DNA polymerase III subunit beta n=1 Tax=Sinorhizobium sp. CCBAU 05631 TaxID=794846 RepID=UPI0004B973A2|nr:DNA polymerase III subunit beta [Sinorhizobium sp. CCBAU 05631]ASY56470.1 DNA polymerase III beta subunit [Sinorhizobium sp. CCBAU 05631]